MRVLSPRPAFATVVAAFLLTMVGTTLPTPMYPTWQARFGFALPMVTVIFATYAVGVLASLLVTGRWSDVVGRRPLLLAGLALSLVSDLVFLAAGATWVLLVGRVVSGFSAGIYVGTATAAVVESATPAWRARAPIVATIANLGGLGLGPVVAAVLITVFPWPVHLSFVVHLAVTVVVLAVAWRLPETVDVPRDDRPLRQRLGFQRPAVPASVRATFAAAGIVGFAGFAVLGLMTAVSPRFVTTAHPGAGPVLGVSVVTAMFAASILAQVLLSRMRLDLAVDLGCALLVLGMALLATAIGTGSLVLMIVAALVAGAGQGLSFAKGLAAVIAKTDSGERGRVTSAFFIVAYVALSLPVVGEGLLAARVGITVAGVGFSVAVGVLAVVALGLLLADQQRTRAA